MLWDVAAPQRLADEPLAVKEGDVTSVAFSPDGKTLAAGYGGGRDGTAAAWCCGTSAARKRLADDPLAVKEGDVNSVAFSPDGKTLAAGYGGRGDGGGVVLWDVGHARAPGGRPAPRERGRRHRAWPSAPTARPSPPDTAIGLGDAVGGVVLWDVAARERLADEPLPVNEGRVYERGLQPRRQDPRRRVRLDRRQRRRRRGAVGRGRRTSAWRTAPSP